MNENNEILLSFDSLRLGYGTKELLPPVSAAQQEENSLQ